MNSDTLAFFNFLGIVLSIGVTVGTYRARVRFLSRELNEIKINVRTLCYKLGEPYVTQPPEQENGGR